MVGHHLALFFEATLLKKRRCVARIITSSPGHVVLVASTSNIGVEHAKQGSGGRKGTHREDTLSFLARLA